MIAAPMDPYAPTSLDSSMISAAVSAVGPRVMLCRVPNATGHVVALGACVAAEIRKASFAVTTSGGSFRYPFVF